ncbi:MAG: hypothetical protein II453_10130 [Alphaproteobacteria bacterium]|nr:hypothetical protein [Alphaproteobacteria bacterium]MBQ3946322.1 hypothetical protein [Alphaproteobacteria bacterium]
MSENEMDWECGFYDEFHQALYDGEVTLTEAIRLYKEKKITPYQYNFAVDYLTMKEV